jgi:hypothetical protein
VNDNHDIANRRIPITPDLDFRRSVFAGHRNIFLCSKAVSISPSPNRRIALSTRVVATGCRAFWTSSQSYLSRSEKSQQLPPAWLK